MARIEELARVFAIGLLLALSTPCRSADSPANADSRRVSPLAPGDSVTVQIVGQPDGTAVYVADDGTIVVPLAGNVVVAGMSTTQAATQVAKALKEGGYFIDPQVTVVTQPRSQVVSVLGEVRATGRYPVNPSTTILDLLAQAGGLRETASEVGYVLRKDDSGQINRYPVRLNGLSDIKNTLPTATLLGGDTLLVPPAEQYYVTGEVISPGKFSIEPGTTVMQAILHAGGVGPRGSEHRIEVKRMGKDGQYHAVHASPNDPIQAGDIIRVKESIF
jgi:polysaccharide export outer membrane protein